MKRRTFLKTSIAAGASTLILRAGSRAAPSKNETMQLGVIGTGRMGRADLKNAMGAGIEPGVNARVVAVCDVDARRAGQARKLIETFHQERGESRAEVAVYADYRELLARGDIDAVIISTPDCWHALIGIAAAEAGKHMHLQKPISYSIPEGQALVKAVRNNNVILQTGSQQRSSVYFRQVCTIIRNHWLGKLHTIEVEVPTDRGTARHAPTTPPAHLDYDMWLGPCPERPYVESTVHPQEGYGRPGWLQVERHCLGMITGWGSHMYDIAQWGMGTDVDSGPVEVTCTGEFPDRGLFDVHVGYHGEALYPDGVRMISRNGSPGVKFIAENGWAHCSRRGFECSNRELLRRKPTDNETKLYESSNHMKDFLVSARAGQDPVCPVEVGHRSNTVCVLHHLSMKLNGRTIQWDPQTESPVDDEQVAGLLDVPLREPWTL